VCGVLRCLRCGRRQAHAQRLGTTHTHKVHASMSNSYRPTLSEVSAARDGLRHALAASRSVEHAATQHGVRQRKRQRTRSTSSERASTIIDRAASADTPPPLSVSAAVELQLRRSVAKLEAQLSATNVRIINLSKEYSTTVRALQARMQELEARIPPLPPFALGRSPAALKRHRRRNRQAILLHQSLPAASSQPTAATVTAATSAPTSSRSII